MNPTRSLLAAGVALSLLAAACGGGGDDSDAVTRPGIATEAGETTAPPDGGGDLQAGGTTTAPDQGDDPAAPTPAGDPVASLEVDTATNDGEALAVRIEVDSLARGAQDTVRLDLTITNLSDQFDWKIYGNLGEGNSDYSVGGISLVDLAGNKRYLVLVDSEGDCVCTQLPSSIEGIAAGESRSFQATFPAPPAEVTMVDVQVPGLGVVPEVPLADA